MPISSHEFFNNNFQVFRGKIEFTQITPVIFNEASPVSVSKCIDIIKDEFSALSHYAYYSVMVLFCLWVGFLHCVAYCQCIYVLGKLSSSLSPPANK